MNYLSWNSHYVNLISLSLSVRVTQIPGCILAAILGILVDVPFITLIVLYKTPILLFKGWHRLIQDLVGREGPFLETVCVPFAGIWILLWPVVVLLATLVGTLSSLGFGCYAAVVAYQVWIWLSDTCRWLFAHALFQCVCAHARLCDILFIFLWAYFLFVNFRKIRLREDCSM